MHFPGLIIIVVAERRPSLFRALEPPIRAGAGAQSRAQEIVNDTRRRVAPDSGAPCTVNATM